MLFVNLSQKEIRGDSPFLGLRHLYIYDKIITGVEYGIVYSWMLVFTVYTYSFYYYYYYYFFF